MMERKQCPPQLRRGHALLPAPPPAGWKVELLECRRQVGSHTPKSETTREGAYVLESPGLATGDLLCIHVDCVARDPEMSL